MKTKLKEICTIVSGTTPKSGNPEYWNGTINWITPAELTEDSDVIYESQRKITEKAVKESSLKSFPAGTVILSSRAPIGKVAIAGTEMYCNQGFKNLICSDAIYNRYLYYFLKSKTNILNALGRGATFKEISKSIVENIEISLPNYAEQTKIVEQLDTITALIVLRRQQLEKLDTLVKSQFIEMFGDPLANPMKWPKSQLQELVSDDCPISYGIVKTGDDVPGGVPVFRPVDIVGKVPSLTDMKKTSKEISEQYKRTLLRGHELLITVRANIADTCIIDEEFAGCNVGRGIVPIRTDEEKISLEFLKAQIDFDSLNQYIKSKAKGITLIQLNMEDLRLIEFIVPPIHLQNQFVQIIKQADKSKFAIQQSLDKLETLKKALMQEYFG